MVVESEKEKDAFYVVQKGDVMGIYKSLSDFLAQPGSQKSLTDYLAQPGTHKSLTDYLAQPVENLSIKFYKGYGLPKQAEEHLARHGFANANYCIRTVDVEGGLFGKVFPCLESDFGIGKDIGKVSGQKRSCEVLGTVRTGTVGSSLSLANRPTKYFKLDNKTNCRSCTIEFDGASKRNPGQAGAGVLLRAGDGSMVWRLREGVGVTTNIVAEYRALILGLKCALAKGFLYVRVKGDSIMVIKQLLDSWKTNNKGMVALRDEARKLKDKFASFQIDHVSKEYNTEADAQANLAISLKDGEIKEECEIKWSNAKQ